MSAATITFTATSIIFFFIILHSSLFTPLSIRVVVIVLTFAGVDDQRRGLTRHSEATGVDTIVFGELNFRAIHGCGRNLSLSRRDTDLHLVVLVQRSA